jgi:hypothetical protein
MSFPISFSINYFNTDSYSLICSGEWGAPLPQRMHASPLSLEGKGHSFKAVSGSLGKGGKGQIIAIETDEIHLIFISKRKYLEARRVCHVPTCRQIKPGFETNRVTEQVT